jgi:hypothetical protein
VGGGSTHRQLILKEEDLCPIPFNSWDWSAFIARKEGGRRSCRTAENLVTHFLLVDLRGFVIDDTGGQVKQQVAQPSRSVDIPAGSHTPDQRFSSVDGVDAITLRHRRNPVSALIIAPAHVPFGHSLRKELHGQIIENKPGLDGTAFDGEFT